MKEYIAKKTDSEMRIDDERWSGVPEVVLDYVWADHNPSPYITKAQMVHSDEGITVDGKAVSTDSADAVYTAKDIVYYESGKDFTYGEGAKADEHTKEEADRHTVALMPSPASCPPVRSRWIWVRTPKKTPMQWSPWNCVMWTSPAPLLPR